ncbi:MAG: ATP-binding protein [Clostridia bacterium]|nr:ATP-binding protein [Clostridia bacterium]
MLIREKYLNKIRDFYNETSLIKIIYGLRRSGKSVILTQIMDEIKQQGIDEQQIIYINFESLDYSFIKNAKDLNDYIKSLAKGKSKYYVFLDEIQKVEEFEKGINSLRITNQFSIFITGSNSKMTFLELSTDLSGRYVSFRVQPLTFKEIVEFKNVKKEDYKKLLLDIFEWGSLPQRFSFDNERAKLNYISDVYDSILLKDVVERLNIKDITSFNKILQYVLETEGREFSAVNVLNYLKSEHHEIATDTLYNYLEALCSTFIMNKVYRYDIQGKSVLKTLNKYYASDLGVKKIKMNNKEVNYSISLENIVYNDLISKGYEVYIGKNKKGEVDFVATKNKDLKYIQVSYSLSEEETREREVGAYVGINDSYPRYIISLDEEDYSRDGIKHINIFDFLMNDEF